MFRTHLTSEIDRLYEALQERVESPENQAKRNVKAPVVTVGLEDPIAWASLYGFDTNDYYADPYFSMAQQLRQKLFLLENFDDDTCYNTDVSASIGMYFEFTTLGLDLRYEPRGVPLIEEYHPLTREPNVSLIGEVDFRRSGQMPKLLAFYEEMVALSAGRMKVHFPTWWRGPLDLAIQLRGYAQFVLDAREKPQFVHDLMQKITDQRIAWYEGYVAYCGTRPEGGAIGDDWLNVPFISPALFEEFVLPCYLQLERYHGRIWGIHSCGNQTPLQKSLLKIQTLQGFECSPWTDLEQTVQNLPPDQGIAVSLHNARDVLLSTPEKMAAQLEFIRDTCAGRNFSVHAGGLQKLHEDYQEDLNQIQVFLAVAQKVFDKR
jgi:hypothetical protein